MVGRIREIVFEDGIDVDGVATEAASEDYVDAAIAAVVPTVIQEYKTVGKTGAQFTTIQAAINAITDATSSKPYAVSVAPGIYAEQVTMKAWVFLIGVDPDATIISSATTAIVGTISAGESSGIKNIGIALAPNSSASAYAISFSGDFIIENVNTTITVGASFTGAVLGGILITNANLSFLSYHRINLISSLASTITLYKAISLTGTGRYTLFSCALYGTIANATGIYQCVNISTTGGCVIRELSASMIFSSVTFSGSAIGFNCDSAATLASSLRMGKNCTISLFGAGSASGTAYVCKLDSTGNSAKFRYDELSININGFATEYIANTGSTDSQRLLITSSNKDLQQDAAGLSVSTPQDQNNSGFVRWGGTGAYWSYVIGTKVFTLLRPGAGVCRSTPVIWAANQTVTLTDFATDYVYIDSLGILRTTLTSNDALYKNNIVLFECWADGVYEIITAENHPYEVPSAVSLVFHKTLGPLITGVGATITMLGADTDRKLAIVGDDTILDHGLYTAITGDPAAAITISSLYVNASGKMQQNGATANALTSTWSNAGTPTNGAVNDRIVKRIGVLKESLNSADPIYVASLHTAVYGNDVAAKTAVSNGLIAAFPPELINLEVVQLGFVIIKANGAGAGNFITDGIVVSKKAFGANLIGSSSSSQASLITLNTTNFGDNLTAADSTVQAMADNIDDNLVSKTGIHALTNKDYQGGTASNTSRLTVPKADTATLAALTRKEATLVFDSTTKKLKVDDGSLLKVVGGGLIVTILDAPATSGVNLESGKHYVVINLSADTVLNLPQLVAEATLEVSVVNMTPTEAHRVTLACYAGDEVSYDGVQTHTSAKLVYANSWAKFAANLTTFWQVDDASSPLSGTFSGALTVAGAFTPSGGIVGRTDGVAVAPGYVGQVLTSSAAAQGYNMPQTVGTSADLTSLTLTSGAWLVIANINGVIGLATSANAYLIHTIYNNTTGSASAATSRPWGSSTTFYNSADASVVMGFVNVAVGATADIKSRVTLDGSNTTSGGYVNGGSYIQAIRIA
jgi:hypothetical protein